MVKHNSDKCGQIMIIEDEEDLCYLLSAALKKNNVNSQCAHSIKEARRAIKSIKPSVVFLDNNLPDGYGSDFISTVKQTLPETKIIMITAYDSPLDIKLALNSGADYFISKPFNTSSVRNALQVINMKVTDIAV